MKTEGPVEAPLMQEPDDGLERLYSARSIRHLLDVPDRTLRRWIAAGKFPPADVRFGSTMRWRESTVRNAVGGQKTT